MIQDKNDSFYWENAKLFVTRQKNLVGSRWFDRKLMAQVVGLIKDGSTDTFAFCLNDAMSMQQLAPLMQRKWPHSPPSKVVFSINVVHVDGRTYLGHTVVATRCYIGNHFAMCVYYFDDNTLILEDSLGYPIPEECVTLFRELLSIIVDDSVAAGLIVELAHANNMHHISGYEQHRCTHNCWAYFPLQTNGHICGVSTVLCMCVATFVQLSFKFLRGGSNSCQRDFRYLKCMTSCVL